ncbi:MAG: HsdR family type I site-specific deoxyribonuclease [Gammaproteobacteria bacterium AqS3]|nr:HsdR family type I site-specific deoxyribonuclease [Gammaproteobacteria bacterium AqS3]
MHSDELIQVELPALERLKHLGWAYTEGAALSPEAAEGPKERSSLKDVVLEKRLATSIKRINPWLNDDNLNKVVRDLIRVPHTSLIEANQAIWTQINQCVSVRQDLGSGARNHTVRIIDFENPDNNDFLCTNQFKVAGINQNITPDIVLFVNGLPLAVIECKSPYITEPMKAGINQLHRYANLRNPSDHEGAEKLFHYNLMMVSTHRDQAKVGTITSREEHFLEWKDAYPIGEEEYDGKEKSQDVLIDGLFTRENFLDILQNFTVFEVVEGRLVKKIPRYQQFRAVHKAINRIKSGANRDAKSGVIWHTQGSGKSLTMVFFSIKVRRDPELRGYKLVFLTDRTQLDSQLTNTFQNTQGETVYNAKSVAHLKQLLAKPSSDIVTAMVQKFQENVDNLEFPVLNESEKIIVLTDEAHRTQYGTLGAATNVALPNAPRVAFTGTPLIKSQKTTKTFGSYIDRYTIEQAVRDEATVQILYEGREPELRVTGDSLDSLFEEFCSDYTEEEMAEIADRAATQRAILEAPKRIQRVCIDIIKHYRDHIRPNGFKAMIVTSSREAAIRFKEQLDQLDNAPHSAVIISGDHNDTPRFRRHTDPRKHRQQIEDFKKPLGAGEGESDLSVLIVKDMLLTGFDAPIAQVMYLDRKLTDHTLLQAIARVNRTKEDKSRGYIVDYFGLSDYLIEALEMFSSQDVQGALLELKEELPHLKNAHTRVVNYFKQLGLDLDDIDACIASLKDEVKRQEFHRDFRIFSKQMDIILPHRDAVPFIPDLRRLGKISNGARNLYRDDELNTAGIGEKVRKLIEEHLFSTGIDPKIPPVELFADGYLDKLNQHKSPRAKAFEVEHAIKHHINVNIDEDPEYYKTLSERLEDIIRRHEEKWDDLVKQVMDILKRSRSRNEFQRRVKDLNLPPAENSLCETLMDELDDDTTFEEASEKLRKIVGEHDGKWDELLQLLVNLRENIDGEREQQASDLGLSDIELPFYNTLIAELGGEDELDEDTINLAKRDVRECVAQLEKDTKIVDFFDKHREQRLTKREMKRALNQHFPEEIAKRVAEKFMELAEVHFGGGS